MIKIGYNQYKYNSEIFEKWKNESNLPQEIKEKVLKWGEKEEIFREDKNKIFLWILNNEKKFKEIFDNEVKNPYICYLIGNGLISFSNLKIVKDILKFSKNVEILWIFEEAKDNREVLLFYRKERIKIYSEINYNVFPIKIKEPFLELDRIFKKKFKTIKIIDNEMELFFYKALFKWDIFYPSKIKEGNSCYWLFEEEVDNGNQKIKTLLEVELKNGKFKSEYIPNENNFLNKHLYFVVNDILKEIEK